MTATTGYRGVNYLNYVKVNDTSGNLLFGANNTGDAGAGEVDINVKTLFSDPDIILDGAVTQDIEKTGEGSFWIKNTQDSDSNQNLNIQMTNAGTGEARIAISADDGITLHATDATGGYQHGRVCFENFHSKQNVLACDPVGNFILDPNDTNDSSSGVVEIWGDLLVQGTTTTVNSTTLTVDDPIITLGGDTAPQAADSLDRGVEFRYYQGSAKVGFFGWDSSYANSSIWSGTGGYRFLVDATNSAEIFSGTDAPVIAGNLALTTNTGSTSTTTGTLVVTGGFGLSENAHIGGEVTIAGQTEINDTVLIKSDNEDFKIQTAAGVDKFTVDTDTGNTVIEGTVDIQLETEITDNLIIKADNKKFDIQTAAGVSVFDLSLIHI